jgi:hypothetical protein
MSINAIGAATPLLTPPAGGASGVTADAAAAASPTAATNASGLGNFFQQFAADLQSLLTQAQTGTTATAPAANGGTTLAGDVAQALQSYGAFANTPPTGTVSSVA